jgi:hypothetical protein
MSMTSNDSPAPAVGCRGRGRGTRRLTKKDFVVPAMLLALSAVPVLGGIARLINLSSSGTVEDARFHAAPIPVVLHFLGAAAYCLLGAFQFSSGIRRRWPGWHRRAGKLLALCGLSTALTGIWMAQVYRIPSTLQGPILHAVRMTVGAAMAVAIIAGWYSIRRRDVVRHEAWMIRAYAIGQGAGTQALILLPWIIVSGEAVGLTRDLLMSLAWTMNLLAAEWIIRRRATAPRGGVPRQILQTSRA